MADHPTPEDFDYVIVGAGAAGSASLTMGGPPVRGYAPTSDPREARGRVVTFPKGA